MSSSSRPRAHVVDAVRGIAVCTMILWHTADAWLAEPQRSTPVFSALLIIGGLAAPLFLLLAGLSATLAEPRVHDARTLGAALRRAGQIVVMGYALKLFAFGVDRGGAIGPHALSVAALALGLATLHFALGSLTALPEVHRRTRTRVLSTLVGASAIAAGLHVMSDDARAVELVLRLDVLQGIGAALSLLALMLPLTARLRHPALALLALALGVAFLTPPIAALDAHPTDPFAARLLDYVARLTPYPAPTTARFPIFPWLSYTLFGAALGRALRARPIVAPFGLPSPLVPWMVLSAGVLATLVSFEAGFFAQLILTRTELFRNVVRLAFNASVLIACAGLVATVLADGPPLGRFLALIGRHSLVVYAVHLELAYGLPGVVLIRSLSFSSWALSCIALTAAMAGLAYGLKRRDALGARRSEVRTSAERA